MFLSLLTIVVSAVFPITQTPWVEKGIIAVKVSDGFVVAWQDLQNDGGEIYACFLTDRENNIFPVATIPPYSAGEIYYSTPSFASEGNHGLFVYEKYSRCSDPSSGFCSSIDYTAVDVKASCMTASAGELHDCECTSIGSDYGYWYSRPRLACNGRHMLLASLKETFFMGVIYSSIVTDLLKSNGQVLYTHRFRPETDVSWIAPPAITAYGDGFVLAYPELILYNGHNDLFIAYFHRGVVTNLKKMIELNWNLSHYPIPEIASIGDVFLYTIGLGNENSTGVLVFDYPNIPVDTFTLWDAKRAFPVAAFGKFHIFYVSLDGNIYAVRYDPEAGLVDSTGVPVIVTPEPITDLSAAFDGEKIFLAFVQNDDIYGVFLNSDLQEIKRNAIGKDAEAFVTLSSNPVKGNILQAVIKTPEAPWSYEIYDVSGRKIGRCRPSFRNGSEVMLELPGSIGPGVYFLAAKSREKTYRVMFLKM